MTEESAIADEDADDLVGDRWTMHVNAHNAIFKVNEVLAPGDCKSTVLLYFDRCTVIPFEVQILHACRLQ